MKRLCGVFLSVMMLLPVMLINCMQAYALESSDSTLVEVDEASRLVYVYDETMTVAGLKAKIGSDIVYKNKAGQIAGDTETVLDGTVTSGGTVYAVKMNKSLYHLDFDSDGQNVVEFSGLTNEKKSGIGGKSAEDYSQVVSTANGSGGNVQVYLNAANTDRRILTYEMSVFMPSTYEGAENNLSSVNLLIKTKSNKEFKVHETLYGNGTANIASGYWDSEDKTLEGVALDAWHKLAVTFVPTDGNNLTAYTYLDGVQYGTVGLGSYTGVADVRFVVNFAAGKSGMMAFDDYSVSYGGYMGKRLTPVSSDSEIEVDGSKIYVYRGGLTKADFLSRITTSDPTAEIEYYNASGEIAADGEIVKNGRLVINGNSFEIIMKKEIYSLNFDSDGQNVVEFSGLTNEKKSAVGGKSESDYSQVVSTDSGSGGNVQVDFNSGSKGLRIMTFEMSVFIPSEHNGAKNNLNSVNWVIKTDSDKQFKVHETLFGDGTANIASDYYDANDKTFQNIASDVWHKLAVTLVPLDGNKVEIQTYFDRIRIGSFILNNYKGVDASRLAINFPSEQSGMVAFDDYSVYYGSYTDGVSLVSNDSNIEIDGSTVYVYRMDMTAGELLGKLSGGNVYYYNKAGERAEDEELVREGSITADGKSFAVKMRRDIYDLNFNTEAQALLSFEGLNSERWNKIYGKSEENYAQMISIDSGSGKSVRAYLEKGSSEKRIVTYELGVFIPSKNDDGSDNSITLANWMISTESDKEFKLHASLCGNGTANIANGHWDAEDKELETVIFDSWHLLAITIVPQDSNKVKAYMYLDGVTIGEVNLNSYGGVKNVMFELTFPEGAKGTAAIDDYQVYYGSYDAEKDLIVKCAVNGNAVVSDTERLIGITSECTEAKFKEIFAKTNVKVYDDATMTSDDWVKNDGIYGDGEYALLSSPSGKCIYGYEIVKLAEELRVPRSSITPAAGAATVDMEVIGDGTTKEFLVLLVGYDKEGAFVKHAVKQAEVAIKSHISLKLDAVAEIAKYKAFVFDNLNNIRPLTKSIEKAVDIEG